MPDDSEKEFLLGIFVFETRQMIEQLEQMVLNGEEESGFTSSIDEIFRIMHTIKGSAAMMSFENLSELAHSLEDLFAFLRESKSVCPDYATLSDLLFEAIDFIKKEITKIENGQKADGESGLLIQKIKAYLEPLHSLTPPANPTSQSIQAPRKLPAALNLENLGQSSKKNKFKAIVFFEEDCQMENIRAFSIINDLKEKADIVCFIPEDIIDNPESEEIIRREGFQVYFSTDLDESMTGKFFAHVPLVKNLQLSEISPELIASKESRKSEIKPPHKAQDQETAMENINAATKQNFINMNVAKLDLLLDLVGELVISEAQVTRNPDLDGLQLDNFSKAARHLQKISNEIQDLVMTMRLVPLAPVFQKMHRLTRDLSRKLGKEVRFEVIGEETEVDKSISEYISDPLIHLIRNALDHGIELPGERVAKGKPEKGLISLEAKNEGGDVWIVIKDDGAGLDRDKILKKACDKRLVTRGENEFTDQEIFSFIFLPGFSTKETVTEYSGRGVGMDVVKRNIEKIRGSILVDSAPGKGTTIIIRIPLTLAIINGMNITVGVSKYTIPITSIVESLKVNEGDVTKDEKGEEFVFIREQSYPIIRLHRFYKVKTDITQVSQGIVMIVQDESKQFCLFADSILGEQQVVVKPLPKYIEYVKGISGCTLLGDGSISLVLNVEAMLD